MTKKLTNKGLLAVAAMLMAAGCGKSEDVKVAEPAVEAVAVPVAPNQPVDMTHLKTTFASAEPALNLYTEEAMALVRARLYPEAVEQFKKILNNPKLTATQRQVIEAEIAKIQSLSGKPAR